MSRLKLFTFAISLLAALSCNDATSPRTRAGLIPTALHTLVTPAITPQVTASNHTCALKPDGTVACWGWNGDGQTTVPAGLNSVAQLSAGGRHTCALKTDGTVVCWGANESGQSTVPSEPTALTEVVQVRLGDTHSCALKSDETVVCWGDDSDGRAAVPDGLSSVAELSVGAYHSCALKTDATVVCWGFNGFGQTSVPAGLGTVSQVAAGGNHSCVLEQFGPVLCWGDNRSGQTTVPSTLDSVARLSAGLGNHTCVLKHDAGATLACWGYNGYGQTTVPADAGPIAQVSPGVDHTCVLQRDGNVVCWGANNLGQATPPPPGTTPVGSDVVVTPLDQTTGQLSPVTISFGTVTSAGTTISTSSSAGSPPPVGFQLGTPATYYELQTTALFTGAVTVCFNYSAVSYSDATNLHLFHGVAGGWTDVTTSLSTSTSRICGTVTSLSPFALAEFRYAFTGFFQPVDNATGSPPLVNAANAGSSIPVKFSLGGDLGLNILAPGAPSSSVYRCSASPADAIEQTVASSVSGLRYNGGSGQYIYVWKTEKKWSASCRRFVLTLKDGTVHEALFHFKK